MKFVAISIPVLALAALGATPALAQETSGDSYAHTAILTGDYSNAETSLRDMLRSSDEPEVLLNLAAVMLNTGRLGEATKLYQQVLVGENADLWLADGNAISSHALARRGIDRVQYQAQISAR